MRLLACLSSLFAVLVTTASANTEKVIFVAPPAITLPDATPGLDALSLDSITSAQPKLRKALPVAFPSEQYPHGLDSWYLLRDLREGQRYEVRVCWAAIQPTEFWLDVFNITHVFDTPELIASLAAFSEQRQSLSSEAAEEHLEAAASGSAVTTLFLRVQAAADFFSTNKTLMIDPPLVHVDIILDPFLANVFPTSLLPTAVYIVLLAVIAWYLSGKIWVYLAAKSDTKLHAD